MGQKTVRRPVKSEEIAILHECHKDPFLFSKFIYCVHPIRGKVKFELYPYQREVLYHFMRNRFNIIKKFRQGGITELIAMYCLWLAMFHSNKNIVIISIKDRVAKKVLKRIKFMYNNLPDFLKVPVINGRGSDIGTVTELEFCNGSMISSIPTTEDAGRSEAVSLMVIDEAAIVRWANTIWAAAFPTLSTGGSAIINSTPYGVGNFYHQTWVGACNGSNGFIPLNLTWRMHPERDIEWYRQQRNILGPRRTAQEIDGDFLTSGNTVFNLADIRAIEDCLDEHAPISTRFGGNLRIYNKPEKDKHYWIGSDVATGKSRDYSAFSIMDAYGEEQASFKGKIKVSALADLLLELGHEYNYAEIAPEGNDIGLAVVSKIEDSGYKNQYHTTRILKERGERKPKEEKIAGWYTTSKTRPLIINGLEEDIRYGNCIIKDPFFVQEAYTFIYDENNRPVALGKHRKGSEDDIDEEGIFHDDSIMGKSITNHIRKGRISGPIILPR